MEGQGICLFYRILAGGAWKIEEESSVATADNVASSFFYNKTLYFFGLFMFKITIISILLSIFNNT